MNIKDVFRTAALAVLLQGCITHCPAYGSGGPAVYASAATPALAADMKPYHNAIPSAGTENNKLGTTTAIAITVNLYHNVIIFNGLICCLTR